MTTPKKIAESYEKRFQMWFARPFEFLRHKKEVAGEWDGGYIAIAIGCMLCERYFRAKTNTEKPLERIGSKKKKNKGYNQKFRSEAAKNLGISKTKFDMFWIIYRHGVQHQGMPRKVFRKQAGKTVIYQAWISEDFTDVPVEEEKGDVILVKISPWKFAKRMIDLFTNDLPALEVGFHHAFADRYQG